jgi:hypothetical protein
MERRERNPAGDTAKTEAAIIATSAFLLQKQQL